MGSRPPSFSQTSYMRVVAALSHEDKAQSRIGLASIPDGLDPGEDRKDRLKLTESVLRVKPGHLKDLNERLNSLNDDERIACVIADTTVGRWAVEVAEKMGIKGAALCPFGPRSLALALHIPKLIEARIVHSTDGINSSTCLYHVSIIHFFLIYT